MNLKDYFYYQKKIISNQQVGKKEFTKIYSLFFINRSSYFNLIGSHLDLLLEFSNLVNFSDQQTIQNIDIF